MIDSIQQYLMCIGWKTILSDGLFYTSGFLGLFLVGYIIHLIDRKLVIRVIERIVKKTHYEWDDIMFDERVFHRGLLIIPAVVIKWLVPLVFRSNVKLIAIADIAINIYLIVIVLIIVDAFLNSVITSYRRLAVAKKVPVKGVIQAIKIVINLVGLVYVLSIAMGKTPIYFISGLGAATAILLLIFKDAILGLTAGIQLAANNMVETGDWIEMPKHGADGEVIDVTLTTVKVQNWDKTIVSVPAYELVSSSFKNWRGMENAKGRRIKRNIYIDINSIKVADAKLIEKFKKIKFLQEYIEEKQEDIARYNARHNYNISVPVNGRHITNIGTFRIYCEEYLKNSEYIRKDYTFMVRQLEPTAKGLPLQIYGFVNDIRWETYEKIQSDIFDHLLSVLPYFDIKIYQEPAGTDIKGLLKK